MTPAIIVDIDGTLADLTHRLHYVTGGNRDWPAFFVGLSQDAPVKPIIWLANTIYDASYPVILCSGRPEDHRAPTEAWLAQHGVRYSALRMRAATDGLTDKEVGLSLASFKEPYRKFLFPARRGGLLSLLEGKTRRALFEEIRPKANRLDGYVPSYAVSKVQDDA